MDGSAPSAKGLTEMIYSMGEANGVIVIILASTISLLAEIGLLIALLVVGLRPKFKTTAEYLFLQSNFGLYFVSLLVANAIAAIGSVMNAHWVIERGVRVGGFCTAQGATKNIGNVATALWTLIIAVHVFNLLFLRHQTKRIAGIATTVAVWCGVATIDLFGPAVLHKPDIGPYFGIAGYWCWITEEYPGARVGLEYFWFFFCGAMSFVLYVLVFLRLRGNIVIPDSSRVPKFIWVPPAKAWKLQANRDSVDAHMTDVAKQMIWFPVAYTIVIIPIAVDRFMSDVPFPWLVFADSLFMGSGLINVVLFMSTRRALPTAGLLPTFNIPRKPPPSVFIPPPEPKVGDIYPFAMLSAASDRSFGDRDRHRQKLDDYVPEEKVYVTNIGGAFKGRPQSRTSSHASVMMGSGESRMSSPSASPTLKNKALPAMPTSQAKQYAPSSPPADRQHQRQNSTDSLYNPFGDSRSYAESDSEDEDDVYGNRRSEWQPSLSVYFENVDLSTPQSGDRFPVGLTGGKEEYTDPSVPKLPAPALTRNSSNRI